MSFLYANATEWAQEHSLAADVRFGRLESIAFQHHPEICSRFGADGASFARASARRPPTAGAYLGAVLLGVLVLVALTAPGVGAFVLSGDRFLPGAGVRMSINPLDPATAVVVAGTCFVVAVVVTTIAGVLWLVRGAARSGPVLAVAVGTAACSVSALLTLPAQAAAGGLTGWEGWQIPIWVSLAASVALTLAVLLRYRVAPPEPSPERVEPPPTVSSVAEIRALVARLDEAERRTIQQDRARAVDVLHERGLIGDTDRTDAHGRELGTLFLLDARH